MAEQTLTYRLTSIDRLVMKNLQPVRRADYEQNPDDPMRSQYIEYLYMGQGGPVIPSDMVLSMLVSAATKEDQGETAKAGISCTADVPLEYEGPRTADGLWFERTFAWIDDGVIYPAFQPWAGTVEIVVSADGIHPEQVDRWIEYAGKHIGLGDKKFVAVKAGGLQEPVDRRPLHGRFRAQRS